MQNLSDTQDTTPAFMVNTKGHHVPVSMVSDRDKIEDQTVNKIHEFGMDLMARIARFRGHTHDDMGALLEILAEKYNVTPRGLQAGGKGNVSFKSFDGLRKVEISVQDYMEYGPELQIAKVLVDEYITEVSEDLADEVKVLLSHAFEVEGQNKVNSAALYTMRRLPIKHPKFVKAMEAVKDSQRVASTREFVRISSRPNTQAGWRSLEINLANAVAPEQSGGQTNGKA